MKWHNIQQRRPASLAYILVTNGNQVGITRYRDIRSAADCDNTKRFPMYDDEGANSLFPSCITHWAYVSSVVNDVDDVIIINSSEITD